MLGLVVQPLSVKIRDPSGEGKEIRQRSLINVPKQYAKAWTLTTYQLGRFLSPVWKCKVHSQASLGLYKIAVGK